MLARLKSEVKEVTVRIKDEVGEVKARIRSMSDREDGEVDLVEEEIEEDEEDLQVTHSVPKKTFDRFSIQEAALNEAQLLLVIDSNFSSIMPCTAHNLNLKTRLKKGPKVTELIRLRGLVKNWEGQGALCFKVGKTLFFVVVFFTKN